MARDTERNVYIYVGIPRDSETYQELLRDLKETGLTPPKLLAVRIADFYRRTNTTITRQVQSQKSEAPEEINEDVAALNASAALDEWG